MTSDWVRELANRKKLELEEKRLQQEKDLSDRKMLDSQANQMWIEVCKAADRMVQEFNQEMGPNYITFSDNPANNEFYLSVGIRQNSVRFVRQMWTIVGATGQSYKFEVTPGNGVLWKNPHGNYVNSDFVAQSEVTIAFVAR